MQDLDLDKQPYMNTHSRQLNKNYLSYLKFLPMYQIIKLCRDDVFSSEAYRDRRLLRALTDLNV
ncbi:10601_t:CDS:2 [Scutellospora calospora]|uniref:10601_t:CDS:1 n=1 Tax=Scutellospora calospora TaxID=85575 RepID=A0ACA9JZC0_9GLOM|nr:10601_t:CDS:2 [Scutellospora calospora]